MNDLILFELILMSNCDRPGVCNDETAGVDVWSLDNLNRSHLQCKV